MKTPKEKYDNTSDCYLLSTGLRKEAWVTSMDIRKQEILRERADRQLEKQGKGYLGW